MTDRPSLTPSKSQKKLEASTTSVVEQAKLMESAGTAWHAVKHGNLELITRLFPHECDVFARGPVGENVFHIAMLLSTPSTLAIARYLVKLYGKTLVNAPYQERVSQNDPPGQYEGETALHVAVVNRDFDMVKFLVQNGADLQARAFGTFFHPSRPVYYGEFPLSFAASTGQKETVSYLKRHGANVNDDRDTYGNTALHMCVFHNQPDMYQHLVEFCGASELVKNNDGETPFLLAARLGKLELFQHIYQQRRKVQWTYGPVTSYQLSMHEIDTVSDVSRFENSVMEVVLRKRHLHFLEDPLVSEILECKWNRFGRIMYIMEAMQFIVLVVCITAVVVNNCDPDNYNSQTRVDLEYVCVVFAIINLFMEIWDAAMRSLAFIHLSRTKGGLKVLEPQLYVFPPPKLVRAQSHTLQAMLKPAKSSNLTLGGDPAEPRALTQTMSGNTQSLRTSTSNLKGAPVAEGVQHAVARSDDNSDSYSDSYSSSSADDALVVAHSSAEGAPLLDRTDAARGSAGGPIAESAKDEANASHRTGVSADSEVDSTPLRPLHSVGEGEMQAGVKLGPVAESQSGAAPDNADQDVLAMVAAVTNEALATASIVAGNPANAFSAMGNTRSAAVGGDIPDIVSVGISNLPSMRRPQLFHTGSTRYRTSLVTDAQPKKDEVEDKTPQKGRRRAMGQRARGRARAEDTMMTKMNVQGTENVEEQPPLPAKVVESRMTLLEILFHSMRRDLHRLVKAVRDPWRVMRVCFLILELIHFGIWTTFYGGVGGHSTTGATAVTDDILLCLTSMFAWLSLLYYARGMEAIGPLAVQFAIVLGDVARFVLIAVIVLGGFSTGYYVLFNGSHVLSGHDKVEEDLGFRGYHATDGLDKFQTITYGMIELMRFAWGEGRFEDFVRLDTSDKEGIGTLLYLMFAIIGVGGLFNLLTAMVVVRYGKTVDSGNARTLWLHQRHAMTLAFESRLPGFLRSRWRLGDRSWDPKLEMHVHNHVYETVEERTLPPPPKEKEDQSKLL